MCPAEFLPQLVYRRSQRSGITVRLELPYEQGQQRKRHQPAGCVRRQPATRDRRSSDTVVALLICPVPGRPTSSRYSSLSTVSDCTNVYPGDEEGEERRGECKGRCITYFQCEGGQGWKPPPPRPPVTPMLGRYLPERFIREHRGETNKENVKALRDERKVYTHAEAPSSVAATTGVA